MKLSPRMCVATAVASVTQRLGLMQPGGHGGEEAWLVAGGVLLGGDLEVPGAGCILWVLGGGEGA